MAASFENLASAALASGRFDRAARLFGAAEAVRESSGVVNDPSRQARVDADVAALRARRAGGTIDGAWAEGRAMSPRAAVALASAGREKGSASGWASLTAAECEVARLVAEGLSNRDIGGRLQISLNTVQVPPTSSTGVPERST